MFSSIVYFIEISVDRIAEGLETLYHASVKIYEGSRLTAQIIKHAIVHAYYRHQHDHLYKDGYYMTHYTVHSKIYSILYKKYTGPSPIIGIVDNATQTDITDILLPFMGPNFNFHGTPVTPSLFGYSSITFIHNTPDLKMSTFVDAEPIKFSL